MEQMYLIEIFLDRVTIFTDDSEESNNSADKNLIIKIKFGPNTQFIIKEGQLAVSTDDKKDDVIEVTTSGRKQWSRTIRVGKSYLFPSYPDTVLTMLSKFPLEIEVWNDDEKEEQIYVGIGTMVWHTSFFHYLKETSNACKPHEPLSLKEITTLYQECCCRQAGEITFLLRLSALGATIITEFQQIMSDPDKFCFRTNKAPSMFECKRIEGDDPNFCMVGSLYETTTLEDPDVVLNANKKIEICTELQSCGVAGADSDKAPCEHGAEEPASSKKYPINKIRMGDIAGPCGNANCPLAHKVRMYIRNLDTYKTKAGTITEKKTDDITKKICGGCSCKDDRWHREDCPDKPDKKPDAVECKGCGGKSQPGETCAEKKEQFFGTGATPKGSKTQTQYVTKVPDYKDAIFRRDYIVENFFSTLCPPSEDNKCGSTVEGTEYSIVHGADHASSTKTAETKYIGNECVDNQYITEEASDNKNETDNKLENKNPWIVNTNPWVLNAEIPMSSRSQKMSVYNVTTEVTDDCKCNPPKPSPPCKTFDCDCVAETSNIAARKQHKPFCPMYKHKSNCPVSMMHVQEEQTKKEDDEDEAEPLPYGLPPIALGPCPVMGRPCSVPDGFARMYKTAALPPQPASYSDAGKVCCSKEYERIRKAIKEYMTYQKDHDLRCVNKFNVDTERRCCDKEQVLMSLMGKQCCGAHKLALHEKAKEDERNKK